MNMIEFFSNNKKIKILINISHTILIPNTKKEIINIFKYLV